MPIWLPFSEGSIAGKMQTIRSENSTLVFVRTKTRFHRPTQCNGSWLLSRMVVYSPNGSFLCFLGAQIHLQPPILAPLLLGSILSRRNQIKSKIQLCFLAFLSFRNLVLVSDPICATITVQLWSFDSCQLCRSPPFYRYPCVLKREEGLHHFLTDCSLIG